MRFHDKEAEASDFTEKTFYGPIWKQTVFSIIRIMLWKKQMLKGGISDPRNKAFMKMLKWKKEKNMGLGIFVNC